MQGSFSTPSTSTQLLAVPANVHQETNAASAAVDAGNTTKKTGSRKRNSSGVKKPPARPHKRLEIDVLQARIADMEKKKSLLKSKLVLLEARLETHLLEQNLRVSTDDAV